MSAYTKSAKTKVKEDTEHPSADRTSRFAIDRLLRTNKFTILHRPNKGATIWGRKERGLIIPYEQEEALRLLDKNDVADATYNDFLLECGVDQWEN